MRAILVGVMIGAGAAATWVGDRAPAHLSVGAIRIAESDIARGARLYAENCAACHGERGQGQPDWRLPGPDGILPAPPHDGSGHTWHHDDMLLFRYVKLGGRGLMAEHGIQSMQSGMPAFGAVLEDDEIRDVIAYIKSRWPAEKRIRQRAVTERALAEQAENRFGFRKP